MKKQIKFLTLTFMVSVFLLGCDKTNIENTEQILKKKQEQQIRQEKQTNMEQEQQTMKTPEKSKAQNKYINIGPEEAKRIIDQKDDLVIIDVSPKYDQGHIPGAVNYYVGDGSLDQAIPDLDKNKPYLIYCHVDSASIAGAKKLVDAGFERVYRLEGNYNTWVKAGYEVEK